MTPLLAQQDQLTDWADNFGKKMPEYLKLEEIQ
jgi:hypothetical protein